MDGDQETKTNDIQRAFAHASNVLSTLWVRLFVQNAYGHKWLLLGSRYGFLLDLRVFLFILYLVLQKVKN